jgi:poly(U)-specific endoribonuclease
LVFKRGRQLCHSIVKSLSFHKKIGLPFNSLYYPVSLFTRLQALGGANVDIYQAIWDADMKGNGIRPISTTENRDISEGYVVVDMESCNPEHRIFKEVHIPDKKRSSYRLIEKLFDNYTLNEINKEKNTTNESKEVEEFLIMAINSPPVKIAKKFIEEKSNKEFNKLQWYTYLHDLWFRQFNLESGKDLSGFEHVFIGEQKRRKLVGYHFWYKYWLEDNADLNKHDRDQIELTCVNFNEQKPATPYVITVGYHLKAFDYEKKRFIKILKKRCAFFVGISAEGLLALGTVRAMPQEDVPENFVINDVHYKLELFRSPDDKSIRTFYPIYVPS